MTKYFLLGLLLISLLPLKLTAQHRPSSSIEKYKDSLSTEDYSKLENLHTGYIKNKKKADIFGMISIVGIGVTAYGLRKDANNNGAPLKYASHILGGGLIACITGTTGLIFHAKVKEARYQKKLFLDNSLSGPVIYVPSLHLGMVDHGIGLDLVF